MEFVIKGISAIFALLPLISFLVIIFNEARYMGTEQWIARVKSLIGVLVLVILCQIGTVILFR